MGSGGRGKENPLPRWERLSKAKCKGGMGFREVVDFNKTLLGKQ